MRIFLVALALMMSASLAQAGDLTCWYDSEGVNSGADSGNVAHAEGGWRIDDGWRVEDVSYMGDEQKSSAMYIYLGGDDRSLDGDDCPETLADVDENGWLSPEYRPR